MTDTSKIPASRFSNESFDSIPKSGSPNVISSEAVFNALKDKLGKTDTAANQTYAKLSDILTFEYED